MNLRIYAAGVIARRKIFETLISPGYYISISISLLISYILIRGFAYSVDSSGFTYMVNPLYNLIGRSLDGAFGKAFVSQLFAEGPYRFTLIISLIPVIFSLSISSVFRFGLEKKVGALELLMYGPADGTSYLIGSFVKDTFLTLISMVLLFMFFQITGTIYNVIAGPMIYFSMIILFVLALSIYAYGIFVSTISNSSSFSITLFIGGIFLFFIIIMGSFTIISSYIRSLASVVSWILQWLSPFFYWQTATRALNTGNIGMFVLSTVLLCGLTTTFLIAGHIALRLKGVRR